MNNAAYAARRWLLDALRDKAPVAKHFVAVVHQCEAVVSSHRYRITTAIWTGPWLLHGLAIDYPRCHDSSWRISRTCHFEMDEHFRLRPPGENIPALMARGGTVTSRCPRAPASA